MIHKAVLFSICFIMLLACRGTSIFSAVRSLSLDQADAGSLLDVCIVLSGDEPLPKALLLSETLPAGLEFQASFWNDKPLPPSLHTGQTVKWLFGPGSEAVAKGKLLYRVRVLPEPSGKVFLTGTVQIPGADVIPIMGERLLCLNAPKYIPPVFFPVSGTLFEKELQIAVTCEEPAGGEIFFCFGQALSWDDWQLYEGAFTIQHSQQLQAEIWLPDGSSSVSTTAEYYRHGNLELNLQQGWNLIGIPLELFAETQQTLQDMRFVRPENGALLPPSEGFLPGQALWLFSPVERSLNFSGIEPFQLGVPKRQHDGWKPFALLGLGDELLPETAIPVWCWRDNRYQQTRHLQPGKGYWMMAAGKFPENP